MSEQDDLTSRYPIDYEELRRGSSISKEELKRIFGIYPENEGTPSEVIRAEDALRLKALGLKIEIESYFRDVRDDVVTVVSRKGGLQILTGDEQDEDTQSRYMEGIRKFASAIARDLGNDLSALTDEQRTRRDERLRVMGWRLQQLRKKPPPALTDQGSE